MKTTVKEPLLVRPLYSWVTSSGSHRRGISTSRALAHLSSGGCWGSGGLDFDGLNTMNVTIGVTIRWLGFRFWRGSGRVRVSGSGRRVLSLGVFGFRFFGFRMFGSSRVYGLCGEDVLFVCFAFFFVGPGGWGVVIIIVIIISIIIVISFFGSMHVAVSSMTVMMTYDKYDGRTTPAGQCVQSPSAANPETWTASLQVQISS